MRKAAQGRAANAGSPPHPARHSLISGAILIRPHGAQLRTLQEALDQSPLDRRYWAFFATASLSSTLDFFDFFIAAAIVDPLVIVVIAVSAIIVTVESPPSRECRVCMAILSLRSGRTGARRAGLDVAKSS